jgi:hypothetical protein
MRPAKSGRRPLFLDPDRYRKRRLMDASRMLPVLGAFLFLLPVLWKPEVSGHSTAIEGVYLFVVWLVLILLAALFAPGLAAGEARVAGRSPPAGDVEGPDAPPTLPDVPLAPPGDRKDGG